MTNYLMFRDLDEIELTRVINVIEKNGGNFMKVDNVHDTSYVNFTSEYPVRQAVIMELINKHPNIFEKLC